MNKLAYWLGKVAAVEPAKMPAPAPSITAKHMPALPPPLPSMRQNITSIRNPWQIADAASIVANKVKSLYDPTPPPQEVSPQEAYQAGWNRFRTFNNPNIQPIKNPIPIQVQEPFNDYRAGGTVTMPGRLQTGGNNRMRAYENARATEAETLPPAKYLEAIKKEHAPFTGKLELPTMQNRPGTDYRYWPYVPVNNQPFGKSLSDNVLNSNRDEAPAWVPNQKNLDALNNAPARYVPAASTVGRQLYENKATGSVLYDYVPPNLDFVLRQMRRQAGGADRMTGDSEVDAAIIENNNNKAKSLQDFGHTELGDGQLGRLMINNPKLKSALMVMAHGDGGVGKYNYHPDNIEPGQQYTGESDISLDALAKSVEGRKITSYIADSCNADGGCTPAELLKRFKDLKYAIMTRPGSYGTFGDLPRTYNPNIKQDPNTAHTLRFYRRQPDDTWNDEPASPESFKTIEQDSE